MNDQLLQILSEEITFNREAAEKYNNLVFGEKALEPLQLRHAKDMAKYYLQKADLARDLLYRRAAGTVLTTTASSEPSIIRVPFSQVRDEAAPVTTASKAAKEDEDEKVEDVFESTFMQDLGLEDDPR